MSDGRLIALEGLDGAGTTTQLPRLAAWLQASAVPVHASAEPSAGAIGRFLRQALAAGPPDPAAPSLDEASLALLFAADRLHHLQAEMAPAWARGDLVLTDRYLLSSYAYQGCTLPTAWLQAINARARPADLTLYLRLSPDTAAQRRRQRGGAAERFDDGARQRQVATLYDDYAGRTAYGPVVTIDAEAEVAAVSLALQRAVTPYLRDWGLLTAPRPT